MGVWQSNRGERINLETAIFFESQEIKKLVQLQKQGTEILCGNSRFRKNNPSIYIKKSI
jgi:hypothetical protein